MTKTTIIHNHIKSLANRRDIKSVILLYILVALADYILDPFSQLDGSDIDG